MHRASATEVQLDGTAREIYVEVGTTATNLLFAYWPFMKEIMEESTTSAGSLRC